MRAFLRTILAKRFPDLRRDDWLALFSLSLFVGLYVFMCIVAFFLPDGFIEQEETNTFILGWFLAPSIAILSIPFFLWIRQKFTKHVPDALLILLSVNSLVFAILITVVNFSWEFQKSYPLTSNHVYMSTVIIPLINVITIFILRSFHWNASLKISWIPAILGGLGFINFIGIFPYLDNSYSIPIPVVMVSLIASVLLSFLALFIKPDNKIFKWKKIWLYLVDALVLVFIVITCFDPTFAFDSHHENFYLGPVNRILQGGSMLVDAYSQYGVLVIYFLTLVFKSHLIPFTYLGFTLVISILFMGQFSIIYFLLLKLVKNHFYAISLLILTFLISFFGSTGVIQGYPSTGPLRFGLIYLMLMAIFFRSRFPAFYRAGLWIEYALIGIAFLWSFETFVYVGFSYLGICLFESFSETIPLKRSIGRFLTRLALFLLSVVTAYGLFALFTFSRAKVWPDWGIYLDFIKTYSSLGGFGNLPIDTWSPWIFPIVIYYASLMIFAFRYFYLKNRENTLENKIVLGLTLFGIAAFTYYLGRSHPNNLFHISIPAIIVAGYWLYQLVKKDSFPRAFQFFGKAAFFFAAVLIILGVWPSLSEKYKNGHTGLTIFSNINSDLLSRATYHNWLVSESKLIHTTAHYKQSREAQDLINKYMPGKKEIPVFLSYTGNTELLFSTDHIHSFPISDMTQDSVSDKNIQRVMSYPEPLKTGDVIFLEKDPTFYQYGELYRLDVLLIDKLCQEFNFEEIETTPYGVFVVRLKPHDNTPSVYCETIKSQK